MGERTLLPNNKFVRSRSRSWAASGGGRVIVAAAQQVVRRHTECGRRRELSTVVH